MFSKLITSSIDKSKDDFIHPSFIEIIKQLNTTDAMILNHIYINHMIIPSIETTVEENIRIFDKQTHSSMKKYEHIYHLDHINNTNAIKISIDNLKRLKLITSTYSEIITDVNHFPKVGYNGIQEMNFIKSQSDVIVHEKNTIIELSSYGSAFVKTCIA